MESFSFVTNLYSKIPFGVKQYFLLSLEIKSLFISQVNEFLISFSVGTEWLIPSAASEIPLTFVGYT